MLRITGFGILLILCVGCHRGSCGISENSKVRDWETVTVYGGIDPEEKIELEDVLISHGLVRENTILSLERIAAYHFQLEMIDRSIVIQKDGDKWVVQELPLMHSDWFVADDEGDLVPAVLPAQEIRLRVR